MESPRERHLRKWRERSARYRASHAKEIKRKKAEYNRKNRKAITERRRKKRESDPERDKKKAEARARYAALPESRKREIREYSRKWRASNSEYVKDFKKSARGRSNEWQRRKIKDDVNYRLARCLRSRITDAIRKGQKAGGAVSDLGCSIQELKTHLESKFTAGMTWENHGRYGWHIDHIKPCASFDLSDPDQFRECCHYSNLQPLWARDNLSKDAHFRRPALLTLREQKNES